MASFQVEIEGTPYEVDAPDQNQAIAGAQTYHNNARISGPSLASEAVKGMPIIGGLADTAGAAFQAATQPVLGLGSGAPTYEQRRSENLARHQARQSAFEQEHPVLSTGAQVGGGMLATAPLMAAAPVAFGLEAPAALAASPVAGTLARMGLGAASGGLLGGVDAATRGGDVTTGGLVGGGLGAAIPGISAGLGAGTRAVQRALQRPSGVPQSIASVAGVDLPLSTSEAAGNFSGIQAERGALRGQQGETVQKAVQPFYDQRQAAINQATQNLQAGASPTGNVVAESPREAANIIGGSIGAARDQTKQNVDNLYQLAALRKDVIPGDQLALVPRRVKADLTFAQQPVVVDPTLTPAASKMLAHLDTWGGMPQSGQPQNVANMFGATGQFNPAGSTMRDVDLFRRQLNEIGSAAGNDTDRRAVKAIKTAFDNQVDTIAPSPELAAARQAHAQYKQTFFQQGPRDDVGRALEEIYGSRGGQPAQPGRVAEILYGAPKGTSPRVVERVANVFGRDSDEFAAVKQGYLSQLMERAPGGKPYEEQALASRLTDALFGKGADLTNAVLSPPERAELGKLAAYFKQITAPAGAVNYSGTSAPILQRLGKFLPKAIGGLVGLHFGGLPGAAIGMAGSGLQQSLVHDPLAARAALRSLYGTTAPAPLRGLPPTLPFTLPGVVAPQVNQ
jgi:hypothetical protein